MNEKTNLVAITVDHSDGSTASNDLVGESVEGVIQFERTKGFPEQYVEELAALNRNEKENKEENETMQDESLSAPEKFSTSSAHKPRMKSPGKVKHNKRSTMNEKLRKKAKSFKPNINNLEKLSKKETLRHRRLWDKTKFRLGSGYRTTNENYEHPFLADVGTAWDVWQQAFRMLGGYIDCDHPRDDDQSGCSRWMIWAAYVDPNYSGGGYSEYMGDDATGSLDCHSADTSWILMGVYRQEFYQYLEQISKHLWAINQWEYIATIASLAYMTDTDCFAVSADNNGNTIYAGVQPTEGGYFEMALYTESNCLYSQSLGVTYDDMNLQSDLNFGGSHDEDGDYDDDYFVNQASEWWYNAQEYTLSDVNEIFDSYKSCTLCMDYPTYQDGYLNGDSGYDEDDLINQCWKFYSHDSFPCETDCIGLASAQGTIVGLQYGNYQFGGDFVQSESSAALSGTSTSSTSVSKTDNLKANAFIGLTGVMFIATFLAFGIARGSLANTSSGRHSKSKSSKSRSSIGGHSRGKSRVSSSEKKRRSRSHGASRRSKEPTTRRSKSSSKRLIDPADTPKDSRRARSKSTKRSSSTRKSKTRESEDGSSLRHRSTSRSRRSRPYEPPTPQENFDSQASPRSSRSRKSRSDKSAGMSSGERERRYRDDF